jgi:hypothetical protein
LRQYEQVVGTVTSVTPTWAYRVVVPLTEVLAAVRAAPVAEVSWMVAGLPRVRGVLPLAGEQGPVLAFPYADAAVARSVGSSAEVVLTLTDPHRTSAAYRPLLLRCIPHLEEDREGDRFCGELLTQELRRWPPSRVLADSMLLRRENWWWLPRVLVDLEVRDVEWFALRELPEDHVLAVAGDRLEVAVARVPASAPTGPGGLRSVEVVHGTPGPGEALLFGQAVSFPDAERWGQWSWEGTWDGAALDVRSAPEASGLPPAPGVLSRWRRQRALERACRQGLSG